jgi:hypothetical protein
MAKHFQYVPVSGENAHFLAGVLATSIRTRIKRGLDVNDNPAPRLSGRGKLGGYAGLKARRGLNPIRDWTLTGQTLQALQPLQTLPGQISVGFTDARAARIAAINNARSKQFGVSPSDRRNFIAALNTIVRSFLRIAS